MDYSIDECLEKAVPLILRGAMIYQKWTCAHCKSRQTMETPNKFFTSGICERCGGQSPIVLCNYMMHLPLNKGR
jgi:hypothetical protein